jgi:hypothetical protein
VARQQFRRHHLDPPGKLTSKIHDRQHAGR